MSLEDIRSDRIKKLRAFQKTGVDAYPRGTNRSHLIEDVLKQFSHFTKAKKKVCIAGRVMAKREHGKSMFVDMKDASGKIQLFLAKDILGEQYDTFADTVDIGDFISISGRPFRTKVKEATIKGESWVMLAKSLRPLPEKWHGLQDIEERFRRRYLDLLMNEEVRDRFKTRAMIIRAIRSFFDHEKFLEVETPMLEALPGGALAHPFKTHHNALDADFYLRIAPELHLKRLLVGGFERIYELGKSFRNEGIDPRHNPEFTSIEWYAAYWDENEMMECTERCFRHLFKVSKLKNQLSFDGKSISLKNKFRRLSFKEVLKRHALILDYDKEEREVMVMRAKQLGLAPKSHESKAKIADEIYKKVCLPRIGDPTFITNHPREISPLAKGDPQNPEEVLRFQLVIAGLEVVNGFSELNDPLEQYQRFLYQEEMRKAGDVESHPLDEDFIEALEYGMPPASGAAIGIDRLVMLLTNTRNIREVVFFPTLKPK